MSTFGEEDLQRDSRHCEVFACEQGCSNWQGSSLGAVRSGHQKRYGNWQDSLGSRRVVVERLRRAHSPGDLADKGGGQGQSESVATLAQNPLFF